MKKFLCAFLFFIAMASIYSQEYSKKIKYLDKLGEEGVKIIEILDGYLIMSGSFCYQPQSIASCAAITRTDKEGNDIWTTQIELSKDTSIDIVGENIVVYKETIYLASLVSSYLQGKLKVFIRMYKLDMDGQILDHQSYPISSKEIYLNGLIVDDTGLYIYGNKDFSNGWGVFIDHIDFQLNPIKTARLGDKKIKFFTDLIALEKGGYMIAFSEWHQGPEGDEHAAFYRLDDDLNLLWIKEVTPVGDPQRHIIDIIETNDGGYMHRWRWDVSDSAILVPNVYPLSVYKSDSLVNIEWEYIYYETIWFYKSISGFSKTKEGHALLSGSTIFRYEDNTEWVSFGWCQLLNDASDIIWEHTIVDTTNTRYGTFWDGIQTDDGYVFVGVLNQHNPTKVPFWDDPDIWLVNLDKNGCWNGNCDSIIIITGDTTSVSLSVLMGNEDVALTKNKPSVLRTYPNPSVGRLIIEVDQDKIARNREIRLYNINGELLVKNKLKAPKSTLDLSHLNNGVYIVQYLEDGQLIEKSTVIIQH